MPPALAIAIHLMDQAFFKPDGMPGNILDLRSYVPLEVEDYALTLPKGAWIEFYPEFTVREIDPLIKMLSARQPNDNDAVLYRRILKKISKFCEKAQEKNITR